MRNDTNTYAMTKPRKPTLRKTTTPTPRPSDIDALWQGNARAYTWGNPLDVRYYLCAQIATLRNKKILELGCNTGVITACLHPSNTVLAVDIDEKALAIARARLPKVTFKKADMFAVHKSLPKQSFDVLILAHVLPKDNFASPYFPEELLDRVIPLLKRGGTLYLTTPSVEYCYNRKNKFVNRAYLNALLQRYNLTYTIKHWGPWSIHLNRFFRFIPGIWSLTEHLSRYSLRSGAFYVQARTR